jgi:predicted acylesterase/phospholipase RssA
LMDMLLEYKNKFPDVSRDLQSAGRVLEPAVLSVAGTAANASNDQLQYQKRAEEARQAADIASKFLNSLTDIPDALRHVMFAPSDETLTRGPITFESLLEANLTPIRQYLQTIHESGTAQLSLLSAGARAAGDFAKYAEAVQDFDWLEFLAIHRGADYLNWLRKELEQIADVILIDSRTGVTEMGGVCTRQMADAVVSFCAPNFQNLTGVETVMSSLDTDSARKARSNRDLQVLVIPTRIDVAEAGLLGKFSQQFSDRIERDPFVPEIFEQTDRPLWNLRIPYIPKYNYQEQRVIGEGAASPDPVTQELIKAYSRIALYLAALAPETEQVRQAFSSDIISEFPYLAPPRPPRMAPPVPSSWVERSEELAKLKAALLECSKAPTPGCVALWGEAGIGKTGLAARVCQEKEILEAFPDGIIWLNLDRPWDEGDLQEWLRRSFSLPRKGGSGALEAALDGRRFLFVVDDVWSIEQLESIRRFRKRGTLLVLTRDLETASIIANPVLTLSTLTENESRLLLSNTPPYPSGQNADLDLLLRWPLGISLLRTELERRGARRQNVGDTWREIEKSIESHGITAFDQSGSQNRNNSVAQSIRESVGRLRPEERSRLIDIARAERGLAITGLSGDQQTQRLSNLGLIKTSESLAIVQPLVRAWLVSQGEIDGQGQRSKKVDRQETIRKGFEIVRGRSAELGEIEGLAEKAKDLRSFSLARRLFFLARKHPSAVKLDAAKRLKLIQRESLCTYKDNDLPANQRFARAIEILSEGDFEDPKRSQETLGLAGAIYKGLWRSTGIPAHLERSLYYYQRGAEKEIEEDFGYTRINAAFVLDLLASQDESDSLATSRRQQAEKLRLETLAALPELASQSRYSFLRGQWWYGATLAEACFGLGRITEARYWIREALALEPPDWQLESTARQMVALAWAQGTKDTDSPKWKTLNLLVGESTAAIQSIIAGKVGIAFSGGGFRASLFHIGVLARLAELDVLRYVEVLSCVSGGSIIGAHYYLEVKRLLESKPDREITREDFIEIVRRLESEFLTAVQKDVRNRLFAGWIANLRSLVQPAYTRTQYMAELFEKYFYAPVTGKKGPVWLNELKIAPKGGIEQFNPKLDNWRRSAKAPILLLNATTLNTGHNWQFSVSWMGEPPTGTNYDVDSNDVLRRMYYSEAPPKHQKVRLGEAVAASACVPGIFDPIELRNLYPRRTVQLVDGGVHDNQGTSGLLEQECSVLIVSDASGQMNSERTPSAEVYSVPLRSNNILMSRVRESEFRELSVLRSSSALSGVMFLHLKKALDANHVDWVGCKDPYAAFDDSKKESNSATLTPYAVPKIVQERLAGLRTDLDVFSDAEAYSLMLSGYRMASTEFSESLPTVATNPSTAVSWKFLSIAPVLDRATDHDADHEYLLQLLRIGSRKAFKAWRVWPAVTAILLQVIPLAVLAAVAAMATPRVIKTWVPAQLHRAISAVRPILSSLPPWALGAALFFVIALLIGRRAKTATALLTGLMMTTLGWLVARLHLWIVDPAFLKAGSNLGNTEPEKQRELRKLVWQPVLYFALAIASVQLYMRTPFSTQTVPAVSSEKTGKQETPPTSPLRVGETIPIEARGSVNIQLATPDQIKTYERIKPELERLGLTVLPEEVVGPGRSPGHAQVRYFDEKDDGLANQIVNVLGIGGVPTRAVPFPEYKTPESRGTFEIWLPGTPKATSSRGNTKNMR